MENNENRHGEYSKIDHTKSFRDSGDTIQIMFELKLEQGRRKQIIFEYLGLRRYSNIVLADAHAHIE